MKINNILLIILCSYFFTLAYPINLISQPFEKDNNTILLLHFDNTTSGIDGEKSISEKNISYETGIFGNGIYLGNGNELTYSVQDNINSSIGTLEFWIKPRWNGTEKNDKYFFSCGIEGGMLFGNNRGWWRNILNRFSSGGKPEVQTITSLNGFKANSWHHIAITWSSKTLKLYFDGLLKSQESVVNPLPAFNRQFFQFGADGAIAYLDAVIDELRISNRERTSTEILTGFFAGLNTKSIFTDSISVYLVKSWWYTPKVFVISATDTSLISNNAFSWISSNENSVKIDSNGKIIAINTGTAKVTGTFQTYKIEITINVQNPIKEPEEEVIDTYLSAPAEGALWLMPVVVFQYIPTKDGINVDEDLTTLNSSINALRTKLTRFNKRIKFMLEEGSKFRGYMNPFAKPYLGYKIIKIITVYENFQLGKKVPWNPAYRPDYNQILSRFNGEYYVNKLGVKEFWLWGWHYKDIEPAESNMSSPLTGDISNSEGYQDDLPIYDHTYIFYNYNFTRSQSEAIENHMHQLEATLGYINQKKENNTDLFWMKFVGWDPVTGKPHSRAGCCHMPPNTGLDYDWENKTIVESDIEDWNPNNDGDKIPVNAYTWGKMKYNWPDSVDTDWDLQYSSKWFLYWMQNHPGYNNNIPYSGWSNLGKDNKKMKNWWLFTANWDSCITNNLALYEDINTKPALAKPLSPWNGRTGVTISPAFYWNPSFGASSYSLQVSKNPENWNSSGINLNNLKGTTPFHKMPDSLQMNTTYYWRIKGTNLYGDGQWSDVFTFTTGNIVNIPNKEELGLVFTLEQNYPNPFNPSTKIYYTVPERGFISIKIYNMLGEEIETLTSETQEPGAYIKTWTPDNEIPSGIYLYEIIAGRRHAIKKMIYLR